MTKEDLEQIKKTIYFALTNSRFKDRKGFEFHEYAQTSLDKIEKAITVTPCCTELCDEERCSYTLNNDSKMCDDCGNVFD